MPTESLVISYYTKALHQSIDIWVKHSKKAMLLEAFEETTQIEKDILSLCNNPLSTMRTQNAQQTTFFSWPKMAVTISTFPEQLTTTLQKRNLPNIQMPEQYHNFNINNIKIPNIKMLSTSN